MVDAGLLGVKPAVAGLRGWEGRRGGLVEEIIGELEVRGDAREEAGASAKPTKMGGVRREGGFPGRSGGSSLGRAIQEGPVRSGVVRVASADSHPGRAGVAGREESPIGSDADGLGPPLGVRRRGWSHRGEGATWPWKAGYRSCQGG